MHSSCSVVLRIQILKPEILKPEINNIEGAVKAKAIELGFDACGIAAVEKLNQEGAYLKNWISQDFHGNMQYMEKYFEQRISPDLLLDNACSVISVLMNYYPEKLLPEENNYLIAKYAYGQDYHFVLKKRLSQLIDFLQSCFPEGNFRCFVDSAPVLEKAWASRAGLGWIGKNTCLIHPKKGSFYFIGEIITDISLPPDKPSINHCGNCTLCIDSCPTNAIIAPYVIDSKRCISYQTIENKENIPHNIRINMNGQIYGCDICQDVCPWNKRFAQPTNCTEFQPSDMFLSMNKGKWENINASEFKKLTKFSAMNRVKYEKLKRNLDASPQETESSENKSTTKIM